MKIALLTLPLYTNYGSVLQAFALKSYLERFGHDVWLIDNHRQEPPVGNLFLRTVLRRAVESLFHHKEIFAELNDARTRGYKMAEIEKFIYRHLSPRTFPVYDEEDFIALRDEGFDLFIVGSDQVWRPRYAKKITRYFFSFLEGTSLRRISYAASFGTTACEYTPAEREQCARLITGFSGVSVRESSAIGQCRDYFGYDGARQVLDPTLLLTAEDYAPFLKGTPASEETLFCYLFRLKGGMRRALGRLASQRGAADPAPHGPHLGEQGQDAGHRTVAHRTAQRPACGYGFVPRLRILHPLPQILCRLHQPPARIGASRLPARTSRLEQPDHGIRNGPCGHSRLTNRLERRRPETGGPPGRFPGISCPLRGDGAGAPYASRLISSTRACT